MRISEIFESIDGEGLLTGTPVTFIRTVGCNLTCPYCDSKYTWGKGDSTSKEMSVEEIVEVVEKFGHKHITLTGGEPLIQDIEEIKDLIRKCHSNIFNIETNGAVDIVPLMKDTVFGGRVFFTVDYKSLSSGQNGKMLKRNFDIVRPGKDCVKCVVSNIEDMADYVKAMEGVNCIKYISPCFGAIEPYEIVDFLLKEHLENNFRVQLQIHKFIWDPDKRGV